MIPRIAKPSGGGADVDRLVRRLRFGNRKGRRAVKRLTEMGWSWWTTFANGAWTVGVTQ